MVQIGVIADTHQPSSQSTTYSGPQGKIATHIDDLVSRGATDVFFAGDNVHPDDDEQENVPHVSPRAYDTFWEYVDQANNSDAVKAAIPGNHDVPMQTHLDSDPRAILGDKIEYDGVSVYLLPTVPGYTTGAPGYGGSNGGMGVSRGYLPYKWLRWLETELEKDGASTTKILLPHHHLYPTDDPSIDPYIDPDTDCLVDNDQNNIYELCLNYKNINSVLSQFSQVVSVHPHSYQFESEGYWEPGSNGVYYVWKEHYMDVNADSVTGTYVHIDASSSGCTITTIRDGGGTTTIMDVTF